MDSKKTVLNLALGSAFAASALLSPLASAAENPFASTEMKGAYQLADNHEKAKDGACGGEKKAEGKCGGEKKAEGKCGADKKKAEGKCGGDKKKEGSCGGDKK